MNQPTQDSIVVVAEHRQGRILPISYELITCAQQLKQTETAEVVAVILGESVDALAEELASSSCQRVIAIQGASLSLYNREAYLSVLTEVIAELRPAFVCIGHTSQGLDFGPGLAVRIQAACITGVERVVKGAQGTHLCRLAYEGKIQVEVCAKTETALLAILPRAFAASVTGIQHACSVQKRECSTPLVHTRALGLTSNRPSNATLASAKVVVAAGLGIGRPAAVGLIEQLAALFPRAAIGGSRPVCDAGWLPYANQIGSNGATVVPDLYFACGISGSRQHTVGMAGSKFIVAISLDPHASIFRLADIGIVEDLNVFVPVFIDECRAS